MFTVAAAQIAPVFLDAKATTEKAVAYLHEAARSGAQLVAFGETFLPGYPFWLSSTGGAAFNDARQKAAYAQYLAAAISAEGPELTEIATVARELGVFVVMGFAERGPGPASGSVYCSVAPIHPKRGLLEVHRKLVPTYEERLAWAPGDGYGLRVHEFAGVRISALNCWENWMPQARHALYAQGAELHVAIWPGSSRLTRDITRFVALEGRLPVLSAGSLLRRSDVREDFEFAGELPKGEQFYDGGSACAAADGTYLFEPQSGAEQLFFAEVDLQAASGERQNFDVTGHYSRSDVFSVEVDRRRRLAARFRDE